MTTNTIDMSAWTPAQKEAYAAAKKAFDEEAELSAAHEAAERTRRASPEYLAQQLREAAEEARIKRVKEEQALEADREYAKAQAAFGTDRVARVMTLRGAIIMRCPTTQEADGHEMRVEGLPSEIDKEKATRDFIATLIVFPARPVFEAIMSDFPGTWGVVGAMRRELASAAREASAKKG